MTAWDDVAARARGLAGRLLAPERAARIDRVDDLDRLVPLLRETRYGAFFPAAHPSAAGMEEAVWRRVADDLGLLGRWAGPSRREFLSVVFEDLDRRSLRVMLRGAVAGAPSELRLRASLPTPTLPAARLRDAAGASSLEVLADLLDGWGHPLAPALLPGADRLRPDLFRVELELARLWAHRAVEGSRRGGKDLRAFVHETVDGENVKTVLARQASPAGDGEVAFLEGGRWLRLDAFREALEAPDREASAARLREELGESPFRGEPAAAGAEGLEARLLVRRIGAFTGRARRRPSGPAPVLHFVLRLQREALSMRRTIWGLALAAPRAARQPPEALP